MMEYPFSINASFVLSRYLLPVIAITMSQMTSFGCKISKLNDLDQSYYNRKKLVCAYLVKAPVVWIIADHWAAVFVDSDGDYWTTQKLRDGEIWVEKFSSFHKACNNVQECANYAKTCTFKKFIVNPGSSMLDIV